MTAQVNKKLVLLVDGRQLMRDVLGAVLSSSKHFEVCGVAGTCDEAVGAVAACKPDVVLFGAPGLDTGSERFVHSVLMACPETAVMVLVASDDEPDLYAALDAGAIAFATVEMSLSELERSLQAAAVHETVLPADFARRMLNRLHAPRSVTYQRSSIPKLTPREYEILGLLMQGNGNAEIARTLGVSINTVKNHLYSIYRKLGVTSRGQAFVAATQLGLVSA